MPSQAQTDLIARFDREIEDRFDDPVELGRIADAIEASDIEDFDKSVLQGRISQYVVDGDKSDEMTEEVQRGDEDAG